MTEKQRVAFIDTLTQDEVAQLAYAAECTPDEVRAFEVAVRDKMIACGFSRVERTELYLKVQKAVREFQKSMAVAAAVETFKRSQAPRSA